MRYPGAACFCKRVEFHRHPHFQGRFSAMQRVWDQKILFFFLLPSIFSKHVWDPRWCGNCRGNLPHNMPYPFSEGVNTLLPTPAVPKYHNLIFFSNLLSWRWWLNIHGMLWCQQTSWNFRYLFFFKWKIFSPFSFRLRNFQERLKRMVNERRDPITKLTS